ncbi:hypothetical protein GGI35DRAFT_285831 [Trichoderma velutinum]
MNATAPLQDGPDEEHLAYSVAYSIAYSVTFRPLWATLTMYLDCTFRQRTPSSEPRLLLPDTTSLLCLAFYIGPLSSHLFVSLVSTSYTPETFGIS